MTPVLGSAALVEQTRPRGAHRAQPALAAVPWPAPERDAFARRHVLSAAQYDREDFEQLFARAEVTEQERRSGVLDRPLAGRVLMSAFFDASTRTRLTHETAMLRLGGTVSGFSDVETTRAGSSSGESVTDVMRMLDIYGDVVVARSTGTSWYEQVVPHLESACLINGGDGAGEHPTQTLTDLFTLRRRFGRIDGLRLVVVGDLRMRCVRSLVRGLRAFDARVTVVDPNGVGLASDLARECRAAGPHVEVAEDLRDVLPEADAVYSSPTVNTDVTGIRDPRECGTVLDRDLMRLAPSHCAVLHPLPRGAELCTDLDETRHNEYWAQAANGVTVRMGLLRLMFDA